MVKPDEPAVPAAEMFVVYAHTYVGLLTDISDHTCTNYTRFIDTHLTPWCKELSVSDRGPRFTRAHISQWILDLQDGKPGPLHPAGTERRPYAAKTIANLHGLLFSILQSAVTADPPLRDSNPCAHTRLPKGNDTEDDEVFLEPDEYAVLRQHVRADALDIVDALVSTGLRWGEITALQPRDFTLVGKRPTLRVQRAWKRRGEGGTFLGAPKTKKSRRTLVLMPEQVKLFQRRCLDDVTALSGDQRLPPCVGGRREVLHGVVEVPDQPCHASQLSSGFHQREPVGPDHISRHEGQDLTPLSQCRADEAPRRIPPRAGVQAGHAQRESMVQSDGERCRRRERHGHGFANLRRTMHHTASGWPNSQSQPTLLLSASVRMLHPAPGGLCRQSLRRHRLRPHR
ncbi:hypothetical protein [Streptomyces sp. NPDC102409]|uniref:hypothetical protein n=1 Tax=Streptomyces sp. NPDC102409 TaxID=3366172 RepID=UPI003820E974